MTLVGVTSWVSSNGQQFCHAPWTIKIMAGDGDACRRTASAAERNHDSRRAVKMSTMTLDLVIFFKKNKGSNSSLPKYWYVKMPINFNTHLVDS